MEQPAHTQGERIFPACFWATPTDGQERGAELMRAAATPSRFRERITLRHKSEAHLVRLLRTLRSGVVADTQRVYERADFYFETAVSDFERLCGRRRLCNALTARFAVSDIREVIARELFLETHVAFVAAYHALSGDSGARLSKHARWAERALACSGMPTDSASALRAWLRMSEADALQRSGDAPRVLAVFEAGLERESPGYFKDAYIKSLYDQTLAGLSEGESDSDTQANEQVLTGALNRFQRAFDRISDRQLAWERLADLYRRRIHAFNETELPGTRIGVLQRAVDVDPFNLGIHSLDVQQRVVLSEQQSEIARIEQEAAAEGKALNEKGVALRNSLLNGFTDARIYQTSLQATSIQTAARSAWACRLWASLGLTESGEWQAHALALVEAIGAALLRSDRDDASFPSTLGEEMGSRAVLRDLDASTVASRFMALRSDATPPAQLSDPFVPEILEGRELPAVSDGDPVRGVEDVSDWLFSRQGLLTRCSIAAAVFLVVSATALTGYSRSVESDRQSLFPRVMAAAREKEDEHVVELAAQFLARRPISGRNQLDRTVEQVYAEALVNLFARNPGELSPELVQAAHTYRQLVGQPHGERQ